MSFHKHKNGWLVRREIWLLASTRKEAEALDKRAASHIASFRHSHQNNISKPYTSIRDSLDRFLRDSRNGLRRRTCNEETLRRHRRRLLVFDRAFHSRPIDTITDAELENWIDKRLAKGSRGTRLQSDTVNADLGSLYAFARWAQKKGLAPALLPILTVGRLQVAGKLPRTNRMPPKALEIGELIDIIARIKAVREDIGLFLMGMMLFCLRPKALWQLRRRDVKLPSGAVNGILGSKGLKGFFDRSLPIFPGSQQHLWAEACIALAKRHRRGAYLPSSPFIICIEGRGRRNPGGWTTDSLDYALGRVCEQLGIEFTAYQIRHSIISWLHANPQMSPATTQAAAAHKSINTQNIYGHRTGKDAIPAFMAVSELVKSHGLLG